MNKFKHGKKVWEGANMMKWWNRKLALRSFFSLSLSFICLSADTFCFFFFRQPLPFFPFLFPPFLSPYVFFLLSFSSFCFLFSLFFLLLCVAGSPSASQLVAQAAALGGYSALLAASEAWWQAYWPQSFVSLPVTRLESMYVLQQSKAKKKKKKKRVKKKSKK